MNIIFYAKKVTSSSQLGVDQKTGLWVDNGIRKLRSLFDNVLFIMKGKHPPPPSTIYTKTSELCI